MGQTDLAGDPRDLLQRDVAIRVTLEELRHKRATHRIDFDQVARLAREHKPKMIVAGASAYPREIPHEKFAEIAREVGAKLFVDMAHYAGLVAAGVAVFSGFYLESFALPRGSTDFGNGILHFDWVKAWMVVAVPVFKIIIMILVRRLPNTHPNFEMDDFFGSLWNNPVRTLFAQRMLYDDDETRTKDGPHSALRRPRFGLGANRHRPPRVARRREWRI